MPMKNAPPCCGLLFSQVQYKHHCAATLCSLQLLAHKKTWDLPVKRQRWHREENLLVVSCIDETDMPLLQTPLPIEFSFRRSHQAPELLHGVDAFRPVLFTATVSDVSRCERHSAQIWPAINGSSHGMG